MKKYDIDMYSGLLLAFSFIATAVTGLFSEEFGEKGLEYHQLLGEITIFLVAVHLFFKLPQVIRYFKVKYSKPRPPQAS